MINFIEGFLSLSKKHCLPNRLWAIAGLILWLGNLGIASRSPYEWALISLDFARDKKYEQFDRLCQALHSKAAGIQEDAMMLDFFKMSLNMKVLAGEGSDDPEAIELLKKLNSQFEAFRRLIDQHYIADYISFHDILFVSHEGEVVYTLRKEKDYGTNLLTGIAKDSPLARGLRKAGGQESFVDFFYYPSSNKPTAFFIEPALSDDKQIGWFVLQFSLNKFNSLFTGHEEQTSRGEAFLVNRDGYLLTESSFVGDATILKMKLDNRNIEAKFAAGQGNKTVIDYRGFRVLSSFTVYRMMGTEWLIVAKVDEAEVLTHYFLDHFNFFYGQLTGRLSAGIRQDHERELTDGNSRHIMVDMDEFFRTDSQEQLETIGVSTCTALVAAYPGRFGYLAHISPYDQMYGRTGTNLLSNLFKKIMYYDVHPFERRHIKITIIANHLQSLQAILQKLTAEGLLLSQISVLYNPEAKSANVTYNPGNDQLHVEWIASHELKDNTICTVGPENNLENAFKAIIDNPGNDPES